MAWFDNVYLGSEPPAQLVSPRRAAHWTVSVKPGENLLSNGGFEEAPQRRPVNWAAVGAEGQPDVSMALDMSVAHSGRASANITNKGRSLDPCNWRQDISGKVPIGKEVRLTGYVKTEDCNWAGACVQLLDANAHMVAFHTTQGKQDFRGTNDWQQFTLEFTVPVETVTIAVLAMVSGQGKAWFDDFEMTVPL